LNFSDIEGKIEIKKEVFDKEIEGKEKRKWYSLYLRAYRGIYNWLYSGSLVYRLFYR